MTHSVHPYVFRIGILRDWKSRWFGRGHFAAFLEEDTVMREWLVKKLRSLMIETIEMERSPREWIITIRTPRPGLLIGRGGEGIEKLKKEIMVKAMELSETVRKGAVSLKVNVEEVKSPESNAKVVARLVAQDLEKRLPFRRILKTHIGKVIGTRGVEGVRILVKGCLDGSEMGRREWLREGKIPLQTLRANVDFARETAYLPYGTIGIKVWVYKGEIFKEDAERAMRSSHADERGGEQDRRPRTNTRPRQHVRQPEKATVERASSVTVQQPVKEKGEGEVAVAS